MVNKQLEAYKNNSVTTASGPRLTLMLYNGCIKFIQQAMNDMEQNQFEGKNNHIQKAQNIITELMLTLDTKISISKQFLALYEYAHYQLQQGNIKNDTNALEEALEIIVDFRNTWKEALTKQTSDYVQGKQV